MIEQKYKSVSIVVPIYNERNTVKKILSQVLRAKTLELKKEVIVVDDGSTDGTREYIKSLRNPIIKKIFLDQNYGKGYALRAGFKKVTGDIVIIQDADLEYDPNDYQVLLAPFLAQNIKAVFGSRELNINKHSYVSYFLGGKIITFLTKLLFGGRLTDVPTGYKVIENKTLKKFKLKCTRFEFCPELTAYILKNKVPIVEVPIRYKPRKIEDGKKIRFYDGIEAILTLFRVRVGL
ncbi:glycosyltransferase family 2 protein [bacterium]|jgi:dolichol-phosphate mannosyltransferase|nr:glycosyltransferase family 2 protein [bacterium]